MTRRPPCAPACPFIVTCTHCDWQSLTPAPFIVGVSAGGEACRGAENGERSRKIDDVSDPRERLTPGVWPNSILKEMFDMGSIPTSDPPVNPDAAERFWMNVHKGTDRECWIYTGAVTDNGYGNFSWRGLTDYAHRVSYLIHHGHLPPEGWHTDHLCRVPLCVNPAHLEAVEPRENFIRGAHPNAVIHRTNICKYGHELTPENSKYRSNGTRNCRKCSNRRLNEGRARRKRERGYR